MKRLFAGTAAAIALCVLTACSSAKTEVMPPTVNVSIGQQLIDLKKARDSGALSQKEYEQQVRKLIDSVQ
jgi:hypothetical protein